MSYFQQQGNALMFYDAFNKPQELIDFGSFIANRSDMLHADFVQRVRLALKKIFDGSPEFSFNAIIYLRIVARLLRKPQIHNVLHVGQWSLLDEMLSEILPHFNAKNFLYCYVPHRPVGKFDHVNFVSAEINGVGGGLFLPENKFSSIISSERRLPPIEVLLAAKDWGKVYFVAPKSSLPNFFMAHARLFDLEENISVAELEISPPFKQELRRLTPQGQLHEKINHVKRTVQKVWEFSAKFNALPNEEKDSCLDEYIAELIHAEKILAEIFPMLHSDTIKFNFNLFKEFLIEFRIYKDLQFKQLALEDFNRQLRILTQDLDNL